MVEFQRSSLNASGIEDASGPFVSTRPAFHSRSCYPFLFADVMAVVLRLSKQSLYILQFKKTPDSASPSLQAFKEANCFVRTTCDNTMFR